MLNISEICIRTVAKQYVMNPQIKIVGSKTFLAGTGRRPR